jgi:hypothetical protein
LPPGGGPLLPCSIIEWKGHLQIFFEDRARKEKRKQIRMSMGRGVMKKFEGNEEDFCMEGGAAGRRWEGRYHGGRARCMAQNLSRHDIAKRSVSKILLVGATLDVRST